MHFDIVHGTWANDMSAVYSCHMEEQWREGKRRLWRRIAPYFYC